MSGVLHRVVADVAWVVRTKPDLLVTVMVVALLVVVQAWLIVRLHQKLQVVSTVTHRLERLSAATSLLTDTIEAGLTNLTGEVQHLSRRPAAKVSPRAATGKRIATAAKRGEPTATIAKREALSEGEVTLHLALAQAGPVGATDDQLRA